jgi:ribosomal-protein-alanine N-acetyltransferase
MTNKESKQKLDNLTIRKMETKDIEQIMDIESAIFGEYHWTPQSFISEIENDLGNYFVAIENNSSRIVGYGGFWLIFDEAHITTIAVIPTHRNKGLGEILLQKMIEIGYAKNAKWFTLEVRSSNISAQNLYYKYGFKSLGLRKKYYQDNDEDALIMWTENIWDTKFKSLFQDLKKALKLKITA